MIKKIIYTLYILVLTAMAAATIVEKYNGTAFARENVYGSWWFTLLWALLAAVGIFYFVRRKVRRASTVLLHISLAVILVGAFITRVSSERGVVKLRIGEPVGVYYTQDGDEVREERLPFTMRLTSFDVEYHDGTSAAADYVSRFSIDDEGETTEASVSMNNIYSYGAMRFYQASYDEDLQGSTLSINSDPFGIPVTYVGYALLFIALIWMLIDPSDTFRRLLRSPLLRKGALSVILLTTSYSVSAAPTTFPEETAKRLGELNILYNNRICPLQTLALDFTKKIYGSASYEGLSAEQVVTGWIFWGEEWKGEPFIKMKGGEMKDRLALPDYCSLNIFFNRDMGGYTIGPYVREYYSGQTDKFHKQVAEIDNKIQLIMELRHGAMLKIFPYTFKEIQSAAQSDPTITAGATRWYAPSDKLPSEVDADHALFIGNVFTLIGEYAVSGEYDKVDEIIEKLKRYQEENAGASLPSAAQVKAERINNAIPFASILFMANLTLGFVALFYTIWRMTRGKRILLFDRGMPILMFLSFVALTAALILRWVISGNIPMSNGYETMLVVAWFVQLISLLMLSRARIVLVFGFLLSGFFLLVSHIDQMDPAIGQMMPVLNSPLLSIHVSIIMMSYALLSLTFICGVMGIFMRAYRSELQALSQVFLYPALTTMGLGIFIGAIWANVSWGTYWSWDAKETWALITFMIYAIAVHTQSMPMFRRPLTYHVFMTLAFLSILMTYFGVNYFLGGMHSYA